jgi:nicotinate-nucleotide adenylyltransferase
MKRIGLFGGGFDPIHEGHLRIARVALDTFELDKVYFIPLKTAVHKQQPQLSTEDRLQKIEKAVSANPSFVVDITELQRSGPSYAIDTVRHFQQTFTDTELYYIIGSDAFEQFATWKDPEQLLQLAKFIVVARPRYDFSKIESMTHTLFQDYIDRIFLIEDKGIDISSTELRTKF